jgi:hypothetical protein
MYHEECHILEYVDVYETELNQYDREAEDGSIGFL